AILLAKLSSSPDGGRLRLTMDFSRRAGSALHRPEVSQSSYGFWLPLLALRCACQLTIQGGLHASINITQALFPRGCSRGGTADLARGWLCTAWRDLTAPDYYNGNGSGERERGPSDRPRHDHRAERYRATRQHKRCPGCFFAYRRSSFDAYCGNAERNRD